MDSETLSFTRRDALKTIGAGAAWLGLGLATGGRVSAAAPAKTTQPFTLPKLPYAYDALEPHFDAQTMEIHHSKHHQAYINNANNALAQASSLQRKTAEELLKDLNSVPESIRTAVRNNVGGHVNHSFFWQIIGPRAGGAPGGALATAINRSFGSLDAFKAQFADAASKRFGSGWAWLSVQRGALTVHSTANQDSPLIEGLTPILGLDVWEHAYYLRYQNRRADFITAFWNVVNWPQVETFFAAAR